MSVDINANDLSPEQVRAMVRAMHQVAKANGCARASMAVLTGLHDICRKHHHSLEPLERLTDGTFDAGGAALFASDSLRDTLVLNCMLLAIADGGLSVEEKSAIAAVAAAVGMSERRLNELYLELAQYIFSQANLLVASEGKH